jgi:transketolase
MSGMTATATLPTAAVPPAPPRPGLGYDDLPHLLSLMTGAEKHEPSATSTLDVLWVLYDRVLDVAPGRREDPDRDRFLLSKGHGPMAYYAVLAAKGFLDPEVLPTFGAYDSPLGHHPDRARVPGVEVSSGSLGHGLPLAVGTALGLRLRAAGTGRPSPRVVVLVGDAEMDEGSNHEALAYAGAVGLDTLTTVVVDNDSATHGWPGGLASRFAAEGWDAVTVDGRDHDALTQTLTRPRAGRPHAVVARVEAKSATTTGAAR